MAVDPISIGIAAGSALFGAASSAIGAGEAAQERKKAEGILKAREREEQNTFNQEYNKNYLETDAAKTAQNKVQEQMQQQADALNNNAIKTGATTETKVANADKMQKSYTNFMGDMVARGEAYKRALLAAHQNRQAMSDNQKLGTMEGNAQSYSNAGNNIAQGVGNLGAAFLQAYSPSGNNPLDVTPGAAIVEPLNIT